MTFALTIDQYVAATMLFLAAKIEEETLKLRYIVNNCLDKWEPTAQHWDPHGNVAVRTRLSSVRVDLWNPAPAVAGVSAMGA